MKVTHVVTKQGAILHAIGDRVTVREAYLDVLYDVFNHNGLGVWDLTIKSHEGESPLTIPVSEIYAIGEDHEYEAPEPVNIQDPIPTGMGTNITKNGVMVEL